MVIQEDDYIIIRRNNVWMLAQVAANRPVMFCKQKLHLENAIGQNYGTLFEVKDGKLFLLEDVSNSSCSEESSDINAVDNRYLNDDGKSQKLTKDDIEIMKQEGLPGEEIVKNLVENSTTFKSKTQYAQEKYLKKKNEKYKSGVVLLQPNTRLLSEMYYMQGPLKICNLRVDSLAQMLTTTNIIASGRYIVIDSCQGLLVAAVLERLGPDGSVVQLYPGPGPVSSYRHAVNALNYKPKHLSSVLCGMPLGKAVELCRVNNSTPPDENLFKENADEEDVEIDDEVCEKTDASQKRQGKAVELCRVNNSTPLDENLSKENAVEEDVEIDDEVCQKKDIPQKRQGKAQRKKQRVLEEIKAREMLSEKNMDGFLIATKHYSAEVILDLLEFLAPSRPFSVFSPFMPSLVECYEKLKCSGSTVFLKLSETWMRKYQILPNRTHPDMTMSGCGGYVLSGIKVISRTSLPSQPID